MIEISISDNAEDLGRRAASAIACEIRKAIEERGWCRIVLATGSSQFEMYGSLVKEDLDWSRVEMFHLDEYVGLPENHAASFRFYLSRRFVDKVHPGKVNFVCEDNIEEVSQAWRESPVDIGVIGIGENGHIAFNDPPADFESDDIYRIVTLDDRCRKQQVGEGWFSKVSDVPEKAVTMLPKAIMGVRHIITACPHTVKAEAVIKAITTSVSPRIPSTILKTHPDWKLFLDRDSASLLLGM